MKSIIAASALAAAVVLTPAAALADTPYAQASATVASNGTLAAGKNVSDVRRVERGTYCLVIDENVDLRGDVAIHVTPIGRYTQPRSLSVLRGSRSCDRYHGHDGDRYRSQDADRYRDRDHDRYRTVAVFSRLGNGAAADTGFYLTVS
ncbi:MAG: hypothetical protein HOW59_36195 [Nonomuraea sp.]|nr:hypothetical protein [Nonomuraea sp.]